MPYATPNLTTLQQQALSDIQSAVITDLSGNKVDGLLQKAVLRVLALVQAGFAYLHFRFLDYIALQATPFTSTDEFLAGWMALKGVTRKDSAAATGTVQFSGTPGTDMPAGTLISRGDGATYATTADAITSGSSIVTASVVASSAGAGGTIVAGSTATLSSPIVGINGTGSFTASLTPGADQETDDSLRTRGLIAYAAPSQGGAASDYVEWSLEVPGVTRAWCPPSTAGAGTVQVYFMLDDVEVAHGGFPQGTNGVATLETRATAATGDQLALANYLYPLRPVTALVYALAPTPDPLSYTVANLFPSTAPVRAGVQAALIDMHRRVASPGGTTRPDGGTGGTLYESDWVAAIKSVPGILSFDVTSPTGTVTAAVGHMPSFNTVTFT